MARVAFTPTVRSDYEQKWATCEVDYEPETVKAVAKRVLAVKAQCSGYWSIPWWFIALCWLRECNLNPKGCLHNGELIIGTGRKTKLEPAGRGPFATWDMATRDALKLKKYDKETDWSLGAVAFKFEGFNGFGYRNKGLPSPYLWSHTNHYADGSWDGDPKGGKYIRDHVHDPNAYDKQIGVMAVLKVLQSIDPSIRFSADMPPPPDIEQPKQEQARPASGGFFSAILTLLASVFKRSSQ